MFRNNTEREKLSQFSNAKWETQTDLYTQFRKLHNSITPKKTKPAQLIPAVLQRVTSRP